MERDSTAWPGVRPATAGGRKFLQTSLDLLSRWQQRHALLLFLLLGAALFAVDGLRESRRSLTVPANVLADPVAAARWLEDEVLYREALARGLGEGDIIIRRRLVQKMRLLLETGVDVADPDPAELRAWIEQHPGRYGGVARVTLDHVFVSRSRHGTALGAAAAALRLSLDNFSGRLDALSDPHPAGTRLEDMDSRGLERVLGTALAERIAELAPGRWQGPLPSALGLHFIRVQSRETRAVDLAAVDSRARRDWLVEQRRQGTQQALDALLRRYDIPSSPAAP
jgi:peptidyl-prolyl cis-trans isomerase C